MKGIDILEQQLEEEYQQLKDSIQKPNILLIGGTGVGKSSLVNLIFGEELAEVGTGESVTEQINIYQQQDIPVVLYDTVGYEIGTEKQAEFMEKVVDFAIEEGKSVEDKIHLVWYVIDASGNRVTELDLKVIKKIYQAGIPIGVLFSKADLVTKDELEALEKEVLAELPNLATFNLTTMKLPELAYLDLKKLLNWSQQRLPEALRIGFIKAQKRNLELKKEKAKSIIVQHTSGSGAVAFTPIPFSDAPVLLGNQAGMLARVLNVYDLEGLLKQFKGLVGTLGVGKIISSSGIWLVAQLVKFVPLKGAVVGGMISASVAAGITSAMGFAVSELCYNISKLAIEGKEGELKHLLRNLEPLMSRLFKSHFESETDEVGVVDV
ncbi:YcjF family protein [Fuchsiella alkaliacetigena]|uniref:YcjF family protein n=1 Tax=Fuchsiella alkaliacetigena TaxID=957042 RepID=UPI00200B8200|nr:GTPase [Fuchsiella alkaliacetigena]MCK8824964.1 50S ribosome-binding GTPase [Fuchsiella alkaliacetigena]